MRTLKKCWKQCRGYHQPPTTNGKAKKAHCGTEQLKTLHLNSKISKTKASTLHWYLKTFPNISTKKYWTIQKMFSLAKIAKEFPTMLRKRNYWMHWKSSQKPRKPHACRNPTPPVIFAEINHWDISEKIKASFIRANQARQSIIYMYCICFTKLWWKALSRILLKNGQICFKNLAVFTPQNF